MFGFKVGRSAAVAAVLAGATFAGAALPATPLAQAALAEGRAQEQKKMNELFDASASDLDVEKGEVLDDGVRLIHFDNAGTELEAHPQVLRYVASGLPQDLVLDQITGLLSGTVSLDASSKRYEVPVEVTYVDNSTDRVVLSLSVGPKEGGSEREAGPVAERPDLGKINGRPDGAVVKSNLVPTERADLGKIIGGVLGGLLGLGILGGIIAALMNFFK